MSTETIEKKFARGDKRGKAIEIMKKYPTGHKFEECTKEIGNILGIPEGSARSYYRFIVKEKLIPDFVASNPTERKPRTKVEKTDTPHAPETDPPKTGEKRGSKDRLATIKAVADKRKKKDTRPEGTPAEEQLKQVLETA
jgi:hypothetical protein